MQITFNGEPRQLAANTTVATLLDELKVTTRHVAVEVNYEVIPRERHSDTVLREGDQVEVVTLVGGG
jgi:sulfur carrier protein